MRKMAAVHTSYDFVGQLRAHGLRLDRLPLETLQLNVTRLCNQACRHCHVDASPKRSEQMDRKTVDRCLELLAPVHCFSEFLTKFVTSSEIWPPSESYGLFVSSRGHDLTDRLFKGGVVFATKIDSNPEARDYQTI